jgi:acetyl-CoA synthetase
VVFGGFSPEALKDRILDSDCRVLITADEGVRGGKQRAPESERRCSALEQCPNVHTVLVVRRTGGTINWHATARSGITTPAWRCITVCEPEPMARKTRCSSSTPPAPPENPRACCTPRPATCCFAAMTHKYTFDYHDGEIYWCTADVGWVTGHSYIVYGPLANGATTLMFEGIPTYPDMHRASGR